MTNPSDAPPPKPNGIASPLIVEHHPSEHRFVVPLPEGGGEAELIYARPDRRTLDLQHTEVPEPGRGHGIAETLARAAIAYARAEGLEVIPTCPFVRRWLHKHPDEGAGVVRPDA